MKKQFIDRKRAASGEREDEVGVSVMTRPARLALPPKPSLQYQDGFGARAEPPKSREVRIVPDEPYTGDFNYENWLLSKEKADAACFACRHVSQRREIVAKFGKGAPNSGLNMNLGMVEVSDLDQEPLNNHLVTLSNPLDNLLVLERVDDMLHKLTIDRSDLFDGMSTFSGFTLEVAFYSRIQFDFIVEGSDLRLAPLGKAKFFFPKQYSKMIVHLDMLRFA